MNLMNAQFQSMRHFLKKRVCLLTKSQVSLCLVVTIPFVIQVVGIVGLVGYLSYRSGQQAVEDLAYQLMTEIGDRIQANVDGYFTAPKLVVQSNAALLRQGRLDGYNLAMMERQFVQQLQTFPGLSAVAIATEDGDFLSVERPSADGLVIRRLDSALTDRAFYRYKADQNGQHPTLKETRYNYNPHNDPPSDPWYRKAKTSRDGIWSLGVNLSQGQDKPILHLVQFLPFYDAAGRFQGVLGSSVYLTQIGKFLRSLNTGSTGQVFLMERNGLLVATSTDETPFDNTPRQHWAENVAVHPRRLTVLQSQHPLTSATAAMLAKQSIALDRITQPQQHQLWWHQHRYFVQVSPLRGDLNWLMVVVLPASDFMDDIQANLHRTVLLCGLALLSVVWISIWTCRRMMRSLRRLTQATEAVAAGILDQPLPVSRIAEVESLAASFRQMVRDLQSADQLRQHYAQDLEQQVATKTIALTEAQRIARVGSWEFDVATGESHWSAEQFRILGFDPEVELPSYPDIFEMVPPDDQPPIQAAVEAAIAHGTPYEVEHRLICADGSICHVVSRGEAVVDDQGRVVKLRGTITDISDRKQTEEQLRQSEATNRALLVAIPDLLLRIGRDGSCYDLIPPADAQAGTFLLIHRHLSEVLPPDVMRHQLERIEQALATGELQIWEHQIPKDGRLCDEEVRLVPCGEDECLVIVRDITERKRAEMALQQAKQQLEDRIADLDQRNQEMVLLGQMSDFLQVCVTVEEAYRAIANLVAPLFPGCSGGIFMIDPASNLAQQLSTWGTSLHSASELKLNDCWALRRGQIHWASAECPGLRCKHSDNQAMISTLCVPMSVQGDTLGLFYLNTESPSALPDTKQQLARTVAEQIALAIANLTLRETLQQQSIRDPLTGLFNRRYLEESFAKEIARAQRKHHSIGVIMLDIDHFKQFNDTYGHDAGDYVLQAVSSLVSSRVRSSDLVCRYGGEEILLILPESTLDETFRRAEEICTTIAHLTTSHHGQDLGRLTASLGVASFPQHGITGAMIVQASDTALYRAKAAGRNQVIVAS